jgi:flagellar M-ring protein FliF
MADTLPQTLSKQFSGLSRLPAHRQFGLVLGLAVVAAVAVGVALWGFTPRYTVLLSGASSDDAAAAVEALDRREIPHRLDERGGALMVPAARVHEARLALATEGLPRAHGVGFELLDEQRGFVASEALESARYQRALEGEIARSIETLDSIESARVHLALPRQSVFLRDRVKPSASVLVNLHPGRSLDDAQIAGIVNLVASSVTGLETERVTVVDQRGRLLSRSDETGGGASPSRQLDYTRRIEDAYRQRVEDILAPLVGRDGMRVQVTAEVDFTEVESTLESYDPNKSALRSEQVSEESSPGGLVGGVPGSLTNQPPGGATVAAVGAIPGAAAGIGAAALDAALGARAGGGANGAGAAAGLAAANDAAGAETAPDAASTSLPMSRSRHATRNFELDRKIDHVRQAPATLSRLSVAVVVDDKDTVDAEGAHARAPRGAEEMEHMTALVREAVGFDEARGDRVNVINASFREMEAAAPLPEEPLWQQPWVRELARYGIAALGFMLLVLLVLRPVLKSLAHVPGPAQAASAAAASAAAAGLPAPLAPGLPVPPAALGNDSAALTEQALGRARRVATEDPRVAAQVVRQWIHGDGK